ncbi:C4-dicarboxylate like transporter [Vibrio variabilis]|nr:C4-dicarboxylate like transporter [Vibrio variabilis]
MLIILAVVAASATLEATGGLKLLVQYAEKLLRKHHLKWFSLVLFVPIH